MIVRLLLAVGATIWSLTLPAAELRAEGDWRQVDAADGVVAWTRASHDGLPLARASTTVDGSLCEVLAIIRDIPRHCEWMADCVETRVLQRHDWRKIDMYLRIKGYPWVGVADRDTALETISTIYEPGRRAEVRFSKATSKVPLGDDTVHMPRLTGSYELTATADGDTIVDYRFHADLGGWVPGWVGTRTVEQLPLRTLVNLREHVARTRETYRNEIDGWPSVDGTPPCALPRAAPAPEDTQH